MSPEHNLPLLLSVYHFRPPLPHGGYYRHLLTRRLTWTKARDGQRIQTDSKCYNTTKETKKYIARGNNDNSDGKARNKKKATEQQRQQQTNQKGIIADSTGAVIKQQASNKISTHKMDQQRTSTRGAGPVASCNTSSSNDKNNQNRKDNHDYNWLFYCSDPGGGRMMVLWKRGPKIIGFETTESHYFPTVLICTPIVGCIPQCGTMKVVANETHVCTRKLTMTSTGRKKLMMRDIVLCLHDIFSCASIMIFVLQFDSFLLRRRRTSASSLPQKRRSEPPPCVSPAQPLVLATHVGSLSHSYAPERLACSVAPTASQKGQITYFEGTVRKRRMFCDLLKEFVLWRWRFKKPLMLEAVGGRRTLFWIEGEESVQKIQTSKPGFKAKFKERIKSASKTML